MVDLLDAISESDDSLSEAGGYDSRDIERLVSRYASFVDSPPDVNITEEMLDAMERDARALVEAR